MAKPVLVALSTAPFALLTACDPSGTDLPTAPPTSVAQVATGGFTSPTDAVASPDGKTFYFAAFTLPDEAQDLPRQAAVFETASAPGSTATPLVRGGPLDMPIGLVLSCDGATLYVADKGANDTGALFAIPLAGGAVSDLGVTGIDGPAGLALAPDCATLHVTGRTPEGAPAVFRVDVAGGAAALVFSGEPLVSPTGLHVDRDGTAWVMDHLAHGEAGAGVLFAIPADGSAATEVASDLRMGTPGGVSLTAGGGTAVMPTRDADGQGQLTTVDIATGERTELAAPAMQDPAGLRTAREAGVFAIVDSEAGAIFRAE